MHEGQPISIQIEEQPTPKREIPKTKFQQDFHPIWDQLTPTGSPPTSITYQDEAIALASAATFVVKEGKPADFTDRLDQAIGRLATMPIDQALRHQSLVLDLIDITNSFTPFTDEERHGIQDRIRTAVLSNPPLAANYESISTAFNRVFKGMKEPLHHISGVHLKDNKEHVWQETLAARSSALETVGLNADSMKVLRSKEQDLLIPRGRIISNYIFYENIGLDTTKIINTAPNILQYAPESIREKITNLQSLGLDVVKIVNAAPTILNRSFELIKEKFAILQEIGLDAVKIVNVAPTVMNISSESIQAKVTDLQSLGLNAVKVINTVPNVLTHSVESTKNKFVALQEIGLNAVKVINTAPSILSFSLESIQTKFTNLQSLGLDAVKVINGAPSILGFSLESIQTKFTNLQSLGLDAVKIVNAAPTVLCHSPESLRKKVRLIKNIAQTIIWSGDIMELIHTSPGILNISRKKLRTFYTLITQMDIEGKNTDRRKMNAISMVPIERLILAYHHVTAQNPDQKPHIEEVINTSRQKHMREIKGSEGKQKALEIARAKPTDPLYKRYLLLYGTSEDKLLAA